MLLGFKTELKINNKQRSALAQHAGTARHASKLGTSFNKTNIRSQ
ncbi:MAG: helix-turn-helix domain-containing protein [Microcoleaceae cyanobacterium]